MEKHMNDGEPITRRQALIMLAVTPLILLGLASDILQIQSNISRIGMIRLAMLSFWHVHAGDYAHQALANRAAEITAIWDEVPERGLAQA